MGASELKYFHPSDRDKKEWKREKSGASTPVQLAVPDEITLIGQVSLPGAIGVGG